MRKKILLGIVCLLMTTVIANGFTLALAGGETSSVNKSVDLFRKNKKKETNAGRTGLYHITKVKDSDNRFILVIGKMDDTRVRLDIYDEQDNLVHSFSKRAGGDIARMIVLRKMESARFVFTDDKGNSKSYAFN